MQIRNQDETDGEGDRMGINDGIRDLAENGLDHAGKDGFTDPAQG